MSGRLVLGARAVEEALRSGEPIDEVRFAVSRRQSLARLLRRAEAQGVPTTETGRKELDSLAGGLRHQGVIARVRAFAYLSLPELRDTLSPRSLVVALDGITDPQNFGAIIRSVVALGGAGLIVTKDRAAPLTGAAVRASAGASEHAKIARVTNLARSLAEVVDEGVEVVGLAGEASLGLGELGPIPEAGRVLVVGAEGRGLRRLVRERCSALCRIDLPGPIASLNASVAAALGIYESLRPVREASPGAGVGSGQRPFPDASSEDRR
ncbi:MAG: 23S rRNA (guanosine(2251)-2'-O)-methyltransferase RlmB [Myxococcota bacterium]